MREREFGRVRDGVIDGSVRHALEQCLGIGGGVLDPYQIGQGIAGCGQRFGMRAAGRDFQIAVADFGERAWADGAAPINQVLAHPLIGRPEFDTLDRPHRNLESGRCQVCAARIQGRVHLLVALHGGDFELHAELVGEAPGERVFRTLRRIIRAEVIGQRTRTGDHAQFAEGLDLIDQARERGARAEENHGGSREAQS